MEDRATPAFPRRHLPFAIVFAGATAYYFAIYGDLLIFNEARTYIAEGGWINTPFPDWFLRIFSPATNFSRYTSTVFFWFTHGLCGYDMFCGNGLQILLVLLNGLLIYVHVAQVAGDRTVGTLAALFWYASIGVLDSLVWQATSHDKLGLFFTLLAAITSFRLLNRSGWLALLASNVTVFLFVAFALNCKESTYVLMGLLPLQWLLFVRDRTPHGFARAAAGLALPVLHAAIYIGRYLANIEPWWQEHIILNTAPGVPNEALMAGLFNVRAFRVSFELYFWSAALWVVTAAMLALAIVVALGALRATRTEGREAGAARYWRDLAPLLYFLGWFAGAFVIALNPKPNLPYYLLIPSVGFYASATLSVALLCRILRAGPVARRIAFAALAAPLLVNHGRLMLGDNPYARLPGESAALRESYRRMAEVMPLSEDARYYFSVPAIDDFIYLFGVGFDPYILEFVYQRDGEFDVTGVRGEPMEPHEGAYDVYIDGDLGLEAIYFDRRRIHPPDPERADP